MLHVKQKCPFTRHEKSIGDPLLAPYAEVIKAGTQRSSSILHMTESEKTSWQLGQKDCSNWFMNETIMNISD